MGACSPTTACSFSLCSPAPTFQTRQSPAHFGGQRDIFFFFSTCSKAVGGRCTRKRPYRGPRAGLGEILHNQALISASIAGFSAQIFKPFTSDGANKGFNWKLLLTSGGMPSSHSAAIVAVATAIGMERGLADSVFGLSAVVAGIVMYDAQGVRRAVGEQAQLINWILLNQLPGRVDSDSDSSSTMVDQELAYANKDDKATSSDNKNVGPMLTQAGLSISRLNRFNTSIIASSTGHSKTGEIYGSSETDERLDLGERQACAKLETPYGWRPMPVRELVGHTRLEVGAGALYGFIVALAAHIALQ
ncbi:hypothetical protein O6H91_04G021100 [Diphasiastrum complanatum]|uniref:Uncharacterized protein n=1 Tax=Diphasiastrum complanatum TaxID=34168 RepID=A0ACC2DV48_DIPCM|nr:hypothetical protein O6H91_04G021100 [Diphasiastrum complanatum]